MKRYLFFILVYSCLFFPSLPVLASDNAVRVESFFYDTDTNCYIEESMVYSSETNSYEATRTIIYDEIVTPNRTIEHTETQNGMIYRGVLTLVQYKYQNNKTIATYKGMLYPVA